MLLYRIVSATALAAYAPYAALRSISGRRKLGDVRGRLGRSALPDLEGGIWVHAVSVGEVAAARNLLTELARLAPGRRLGLSVTTAAGREFAERTLAGRASIFAFPFDLAGPVEKAFDSVRPGLVLLTETELWPLFLDRARSRGIPVALVSGRLSDRSFPRYRLARRFLQRSLQAIGLFAMQTRQDAERIASLGAPPERIRVCGNLKFDLPPAPPFPDAARLAQLSGGRPIFVAASTAEGEEAAVLEAFRPIRERALLAIAPRRPERFDAVAALVERGGFAVVRRSQPDSAAITRSPDTSDKAPATSDRPITRFPVYLLDSIGELACLYRGARLAFVGGSLVPKGGQNPLEAWAEGVSVVVGPHTQNFRDLTAEGERRGFLTRVRDGDGLARAFASALDAPAAAETAGERAREFVAANRGASRTTAEAALALLSPAGRLAAAT